MNKGRIVWYRLYPFEAALKLYFWPSTVWSPLKYTLKYGDNLWNVFIKNLNLFSTEERNT